MKTEYQVYCDYVKAKQKANAIDIIANRIISISQNSVVEELEDLNRKWQGDTIDIVKSKGMEINGDLNATARNLKKIAATIRRIAKRNYIAEMKAIEIARNRSAHGGSGRHIGGGGGGR